jgi:hypothetical protein
MSQTFSHATETDSGRVKFYHPPQITSVVNAASSQAGAGRVRNYGTGPINAPTGSVELLLTIGGATSRRGVTLAVK